MPTHINSSISLTNEIGITEDTILTDPNVNVGQLSPSANTAFKSMKGKEQPYYLANEISGAGNAGAVLMIQNTNTGTISHMCNTFYLQAMDIQLKERVQIMETFGKPIASFFGSSAKVYNFSGVCLEADTKRTGHKGEYFHGTSLLYLYETFMRGTRLVDGASIAILQVSNHSIYGYPIQFSYRALGDLDKAIQFSFSFFVKEHLYEIPGVVTKSLMQDNIRMGDANNPNVRALQDLRKTLKKIVDGLDKRGENTWKDAHELEQASKATVFLQKLMTTEVYADIREAINGEEALFMTDVNDYAAQLTAMFKGQKPTVAQASGFGLRRTTAYLASDATWTNGLKAELKLAWSWMPWKSSSGAGRYDVKELESRIDSASLYDSDTIGEMLALNGHDSYNFGQGIYGEDALNGAYAGLVYQTMKSVDATIHRKLQYYWMTQEEHWQKDIKDLVLV